MIGSIAQTGHADCGVSCDRALLVVGVSASEVGALRLPCQGIVAGPAVRGGIEAVQSLRELILEYSLEVDVDEVAGKVEDVDGVGEIAEDVGEGLGHLPAHVQVGVLVLQQLDGVLDGAVGGQVLDDFSVDEEEDLDLVFGQVGVLVLVVELDG